MKKDYEYLNQINFPYDLKKIPESKLQNVADEVRKELIEAEKDIKNDPTVKSLIDAFGAEVISSSIEPRK